MTKTQISVNKKQDEQQTYPQTLATEHSGVSSVIILTQPGGKNYPEPAVWLLCIYTALALPGWRAQSS